MRRSRRTTSSAQMEKVGFNLSPGFFDGSAANTRSVISTPTSTVLDDLSSPSDSTSDAERQVRPSQAASTQNGPRVSAIRQACNANSAHSSPLASRTQFGASVWNRSPVRQTQCTSLGSGMPMSTSSPLDRNLSSIFSSQFSTGYITPYPEKNHVFTDDFIDAGRFSHSRKKLKLNDGLSTLNNCIDETLLSSITSSANLSTASLVHPPVISSPCAHTQLSSQTQTNPTRQSPSVSVSEGTPTSSPSCILGRPVLVPPEAVKLPSDLIDVCNVGSDARVPATLQAQPRAIIPRRRISPIITNQSPALRVTSSTQISDATHRCFSPSHKVPVSQVPQLAPVAHNQEILSRDNDITVTHSAVSPSPLLTRSAPRPSVRLRNPKMAFSESFDIAKQKAALSRTFGRFASPKFAVDSVSSHFKHSNRASSLPPSSPRRDEKSYFPESDRFNVMAPGGYGSRLYSDVDSYRDDDINSSGRNCESGRKQWGEGSIYLNHRAVVSPQRRQRQLRRDYVPCLSDLERRTMLRKSSGRELLSGRQRHRHIINRRAMLDNALNVRVPENYDIFEASHSEERQNQSNEKEMLYSSRHRAMASPAGEKHLSKPKASRHDSAISIERAPKWYTTTQSRETYEPEADSGHTRYAAWSDSSDELGNLEYVEMKIPPLLARTDVRLIDPSTRTPLTRLAQDKQQPCRNLVRQTDDKCDTEVVYGETTECESSVEALEYPISFKGGRAGRSQGRDHHFQSDKKVQEPLPSRLNLIRMKIPVDPHESPTQGRAIAETDTNSTPMSRSALIADKNYRSENQYSERLDMSSDMRRELKGSCATPPTPKVHLQSRRSSSKAATTSLHTQSSCKVGVSSPPGATNTPLSKDTAFKHRSLNNTVAEKSNVKSIEHVVFSASDGRRASRLSGNSNTILSDAFASDETQRDALNRGRVSDSPESAGNAFVEDESDDHFVMPSVSPESKQKAIQQGEEISASTPRPVAKHLGNYIQSTGKKNDKTKSQELNVHQEGSKSLHLALPLSSHQRFNYAGGEDNELLMAGLESNEAQPLFPPSPFSSEQENDDSRTLHDVAGTLLSLQTSQTIQPAGFDNFISPDLHVPCERKRKISVASFACQVSDNEMETTASLVIAKPKPKKSVKAKLQALARRSNKVSAKYEVPPLTSIPVKSLPEQFLHQPIVIRSSILQITNEQTETIEISSNTTDKVFGFFSRPRRVRHKPLRWWMLESLEYDRPPGSECPVVVGVRRRIDPNDLPRSPDETTGRREFMEESQDARLTPTIIISRKELDKGKDHSAAQKNMLLSDDVELSAPHHPLSVVQHKDQSAKNLSIEESSAFLDSAFPDSALTRMDNEKLTTTVARYSISNGSGFDDAGAAHTLKSAGTKKKASPKVRSGISRRFKGSTTKMSPLLESKKNKYRKNKYKETSPMINHEKKKQSSESLPTSTIVTTTLDDFVKIDNPTGSFKVAVLYDEPTFTVCKLLIEPLEMKGIEKADTGLIGQIEHSEDDKCLVLMGDVACRLEPGAAERTAKLQRDKLKISFDKKIECNVDEAEPICHLCSYGSTIYIPANTSYNIINMSK